MTSIKLMLVGNHTITRTALLAMLQAEPGLQVAAEAGSGAEALEQIGDCMPDVVIIDVGWPGTDGPATTRMLRAQYADLPILALLLYEDNWLFFQLLHAGALGCVPHYASPNDLITAIHTIHQGHAYLYPPQARALVDDYLQSKADLTPRQRQVITLLAEGLRNGKIAERLGISVKTVARHRENIMARLNLHSSTELLKYAIRRGLVKV